MGSEVTRPITAAFCSGTEANKERGSTVLDLISILAIAGMFALGCLYVRGCDRLKGARP